MSIDRDIFPDPKNVGQSEYHAIYDVIEQYAETNDWPMVRAVLEEFKDWATELISRLDKGGKQ